MKKLILLSFMCAVTLGYSQKDSLKISSKQNAWEKHTNVGKDNFFYNFFISKLTDELITSADLSKRRKQIVLYFNLDESNNIIDIRTNSKNRKLNKTITKSFKEISIEELNIPIKSRIHNYSIQLIGLENGKPILKCSSSILYQSIPIFNKDCQQSNTYKTRLACNQKVLAKYINSNFDKTLAKRSGLDGIVSIYAMFGINKESCKFVNIKVKAPNEALKIETKRVLYNFPKILKPGYQQGKPVNLKYSLPIKMDLTVKTKKTNL